MEDKETSANESSSTPTTRDLTHLRQITASNLEIKRRISALIRQKRQDNDSKNCRVFCGGPMLTEGQDGPCARTSAVFYPYPACKSRVKVRRVVNMYGPQTKALKTSELENNKATDDLLGVEERLANIEDHFEISSGSKKQNVMDRLKHLEDRILFLEGLSPEYFKSVYSQVKKRQQSTEQGMSVDDIDGRMQGLRESLMKKYNT